jgi:hypothetical protein
MVKPLSKIQALKATARFVFVIGFVGIAQSPRLFGQPASAPRSIAVPAYFYPAGGNLAYWDRLRGSFPGVSMAVATGLGLTETSPNPDYQTQIAATRKAGIAVLAYVTTSGGVKPMTNVQQEIDNAFKWYAVDGIFFDEAVAYPVTCDQVGYYAALNHYVKTKGGRAITVINHGQILPECYAAVSDIMLNAECSFDFYTNGWHAWGWETNYPARKFWHIVHGADTVAQLQDVVALSKVRNAGYVFITSATPTNSGGPFGSLPPVPYWSNELDAVAPTKTNERIANH